MRVWFLTNGHGEDRAAALVAGAVAAQQPGIEIVAATLVTSGARFIERRFDVPVTGAEPPSGGFPFAGLGTFIRDLPTIRAYRRYVRDIRRLALGDDAVVAAGDTFLLGLAHGAFQRPAIHLALAKSVHGRPHSRLEHALLRRWSSLVFARDEATAASLRAHHVRAEFQGNPLIDRDTSSTPEFQFRRGPVWPPGQTPFPLVLLLPGSRVEAPENLARLLDVVSLVSAPARWLCAWPPTVPVENGVRNAGARGWERRGDGLSRGAATVEVSMTHFDALIASADVVVGLAGTANEQAAALGKPVVTFVGAGPQTSAARMREQSRLLGGAARFMGNDVGAVAEEVTALLAAPAERVRRGKLGVDRLGPPGGAARIAQRIVATISS